jgi:hypothetical protein
MKKNGYCQQNLSSMVVNPYVELCAGFVTKLNVSLFNHTAPKPVDGEF